VKIRVLEVLATLKRAGAEHVATSLACQLGRDRFETAVVSLFDPFPGGLEPLLEAQGVRMWHLGKRPGLDLRIYPRLTRVFLEFAPNIIHTHSYVVRYSLPARLASRSGAMVHTVHNLADREVELAGRVIHRLAVRCGMRTVAVAAEVARSVRAVYGRDPEATIPNGIETDRFRQPGARSDWRRANGFVDTDLIVTSVARLEPQKNPLGLIESFADAARGVPRAHLVMAGDGALRSAARHHAARCGVVERVHVLGARTDIPDLLSASDIFVLASLWEGHPVSVMEAMAAGLPVIATAVGGVPELVEDDVTGILAPVGDGRSLAGAIAALLENACLRRRLGGDARERSNRFDNRAMVASYAGLFERLAGARP
jgi:glycosyltransferase involved in cell wall biosynthesis